MDADRRLGATVEDDEESLEETLPTSHITSTCLVNEGLAVGFPAFCWQAQS